MICKGERDAADVASDTCSLSNAQSREIIKHHNTRIHVHHWILGLYAEAKRYRGTWTRHFMHEMLIPSVVKGEKIKERKDGGIVHKGLKIR